jgi:hypothetical protein
MTGAGDTRTFTVFLPFGDVGRDDVVVARALSGADAIKIALEHDGSWMAHLREDEFESFILYRWKPQAKKWPGDKRRLDALCATVVKTTDRLGDHARGISMIVDQFLRRAGYYSEARVQTDGEFDERLLQVAKRREVHRLDRAIATKLIDALLAEGYVVTDASYKQFECSADREAILEILLDVDVIELVVERIDQKSWLRLIFGENGWDLVQDHTVDLGYLIDPIVEPLLPRNRNHAGRHEVVEAAAPKAAENPSETRRTRK